MPEFREHCNSEVKDCLISVLRALEPWFLKEVISVFCLEFQIDSDLLNTSLCAASLIAMIAGCVNRLSVVIA